MEMFLLLYWADDSKEK